MIMDWQRAIALNLVKSLILISPLFFVIFIFTGFPDFVPCTINS